MKIIRQPIYRNGHIGLYMGEGEELSDEDDVVGWYFEPAAPFQVDGITYRRAGTCFRPMFELLDC